MSGMNHPRPEYDDEVSALPTFKRPSSSIAYDTPVAGAKMHWNADGLHIEDPQLKDRPEVVGGKAGCFTIPWDKIDEMRARFNPPKEA